MELKIFHIAIKSDDYGRDYRGDVVLAATDLSAAFVMIDELDDTIWKPYLVTGREFHFFMNEMPGRYVGEPIVFTHFWIFV
jgi:hypothetical protein